MPESKHEASRNWKQNGTVMEILRVTLLCETHVCVTHACGTVPSGVQGNLCRLRRRKEKRK